LSIILHVPIIHINISTMAGIVSNIIQNSLGGFVAGAVTTVGGYAGSAVTGVGNLIENSGRAVGDGKFSGPGF
jgi:hypothetical protein